MGVFQGVSLPPYNGSSNVDSTLRAETGEGVRKRLRNKLSGTSPHMPCGILYSPAGADKSAQLKCLSRHVHCCAQLRVLCLADLSQMAVSLPGALEGKEAQLIGLTFTRRLHKGCNSRAFSPPFLALHWGKEEVRLAVPFSRDPSFGCIHAL